MTSLRIQRGSILHYKQKKPYNYTIRKTKSIAKHVQVYIRKDKNQPTALRLKAPVAPQLEWKSDTAPLEVEHDQKEKKNQKESTYITVDKILYYGRSLRFSNTLAVTSGQCTAGYTNAPNRTIITVTENKLNLQASVLTCAYSLQHSG